MEYDFGQVVERSNFLLQAKTWEPPNYNRAAGRRRIFSKIIAKWSWVFIGHLFLGYFRFFVPWITWMRCSTIAPIVSQSHWTAHKASRKTKVGNRRRTRKWTPTRFRETSTLWTRMGHGFLAGYPGNVHVSSASTNAKTLTWVFIDLQTGGSRNAFNWLCGTNVWQSLR